MQNSSYPSDWGHSFRLAAVLFLHLANREANNTSTGGGESKSVALFFVYGSSEKASMLVANLENNARVYAWLTEKKQKPFYCPACAGEVILKKGKVREHHFAHKPPSDCLFGVGESQLHLRVKREIYTALLNHPLCMACELERLFEGVRPDVSFITGKTPVAVEVQQSNISIDEMTRRMVQYAKLGMYVLWVVPQPPPVLNQDEVYRPKKWEKFLHAMYYGRLYYWLNSAFVMPVHLGEYYYWVDECFDSDLGDMMGGYYKYSRAYKEPVHFEHKLHMVEDFEAKARNSFEMRQWDVPACNLWMDMQSHWWKKEKPN